MWRRSGADRPTAFAVIFRLPFCGRVVGHSEVISNGGLDFRAFPSRSECRNPGSRSGTLEQPLPINRNPPVIRSAPAIPGLSAASAPSPIAAMLEVAPAAPPPAAAAPPRGPSTRPGPEPGCTAPRGYPQSTRAVSTRAYRWRLPRRIIDHFKLRSTDGSCRRQAIVWTCADRPMPAVCSALRSGAVVSRSPASQDPACRGYGCGSERSTGSWGLDSTL